MAFLFSIFMKELSDSWKQYALYLRYNRYTKKKGNIMNKMLGRTNIQMLVLIGFSISEPYVEAAEVVVGGTQWVLNAETRKG